jgi:tetratricopeptide (TPR) repeat protein
VRFEVGEFAELLAYQFSGHAFQERGGFHRMQLHLALVRAEGHGDIRTLELTRVLDYDACSSNGDSFEEKTQVRYALRRFRGAWQIAAMRSWPLSIRSCAPESRTFDVAGLHRLDEEVAIYGDSQAREKGKALFDALRYAESADWYEKIASSPNGQPRDWLLLGWSAAFAGRMDRARKAFAEALHRDPTLPTPRPRPTP